MMRVMLNTAKFPFQLVIDIIVMIVTYLKGNSNEIQK